MIITGIFLAVLAAAIGTTSKQLIAASEHYQKPYLFHLGAGMNILFGPFVDASAYAFAPQVIVAPFACLDVIFNAVTAPYTLRWQQEKLSRSHIYGTAAVFVGAMCTSMFAQADNVIYDVRELEAQLFWRPTSVAYILVELCLICSVNVALKKKLLSPAIRGISLGVIAGMLMGNIFFMKGVISIIQTTASTGNAEAWLRPTPYILAACAAGGAIVGHIFMRKGLSEYKGVFMVTIFEGAHITCGCLSGCVVMEEMAGAPWWRYCCYWLSVALIIAGMLIINKKSADAQIKEGDAASHGQHKFHIAQSFVEMPEEEDRHELYPNSHRIGHPTDNENEMRESTFGRTLEDHGLDAVDIAERGGGKKWQGGSNGVAELAYEDTITPSTRGSPLPNGDRSFTSTSNGVDPYDSPRDT
mmetsp:Transcript_43930/g.118496  ORF Transcript_43930/g.118496 Transcript_43930/m.118496 type:complete len:414 (-) Transcript_43930:169-1410(-)